MVEDSDIGEPALDAHPAAPMSGARTDGATADPTRDASGTDTIAITFKLYATLQDLLPKGAIRNAVAVEIPAQASLNDVIDRHRVPRELAHLVLVNGIFVCETDREARGALKPGDVLAIWPPVAGG